ncbi:Uroporphyrinogen decarboxylase [Methanolapillus ohkumae]|uniref:Uroporphyrinogen decarboxylase n=2 Tax=Methanolapillus ohkumae TaxID=3028298 RepID=A0AA96V7T9_9EURY|nr:Uroporphyrinogen decarboxylase [Methanosarcinaceae archaeon Am2]
MKERFIRSLKREKVDKVPVCSVTQTGTVDLMHLSGAFWPDAHYDSEKMATLAIAAHKFAGLEAVRYPFSMFELPEAYGCEISTGTLDSQPHQLDFPVKDIQDISQLSLLEDLSKNQGISVIMDATTAIQKQLGDSAENVPIIAGVLGPAALSSCLCGVNNYLMWSLLEPDLFLELMNFCTKASLDYINLLYDAGVDAVLVVDSEAGPDLFPPPLFESVVVPIYKKMTSQMNGPSLLHMCGNATSILEPLGNSGFMAVSIEEKTNMAEASRIIGEKICLIGNVSPARTLLLETPDVIRKETKQCLKDGARILSPGCGIAPRTPLGNLKAFVSARDEYYSGL